MRTVAGVIARTGYIISKVGGEFSVMKSDAEPGRYLVQFAVPFTALPGVTVSPVFVLGDASDPGGPMSDLANVAGLDSTAVKIATGFMPTRDFTTTLHQDRDFAFIAVGE
jgi:hypothetical protein